MILTHHHKARELSVGTRIRIEREFGKAGYAGESLLEIIVKFESTLRGLDILKRMQRRELRHGGDLLVDLRIVLHRTASKRIEAGVDTEILIRKIRVMSYNLEFADFRQLRGLLAQKIRRNSRQTVNIILVCG